MKQKPHNRQLYAAIKEEITGESSVGVIVKLYGTTEDYDNLFKKEVKTK